MAEEKNFYKELVDSLYDGVYILDLDRKITYWNKGAERITGYKREQVMGFSCRDNILNHVTAEGVQLCNDHCPMAACMQDGVVREADVFLHHADGHRVPILVRAAPMRDVEGNIIGAVEIFSNDAGMKSVRQQIRELRNITNIDPLTKIGNRQFLDGRLRAVLAEYKGQDGGAAVLFMDIDKFKRVNDTYGHDIGDKVLCMVAATLKNSLRNTDAVGRWGGEEFLAILDDVNSLESLNFICEKLRKLVSFSSLDYLNEKINITVSIGATFLKSSDTPESLVSRADRLMYQSKEAGRDRVTIG